MKKLFIIFLASVFSVAKGFNIEEYKVAKYILNHPKMYQVSYLKYIIKLSRKRDLTKTAIAIAIHESRLGKYLINDKGDYCIMHVNARWNLIKKGIKPTYYKKLEEGSKLLRNEYYCIMSALDNLDYWRNRYGNRWLKIWGSYNSGTTPSYSYAIKIKSIIRALREYEKENSCKFKDGSCLKILTFLTR